MKKRVLGGLIVACILCVAGCGSKNANVNEETVAISDVESESAITTVEDSQGEVTLVVDEEKEESNEANANEDDEYDMIANVVANSFIKSIEAKDYNDENQYIELYGKPIDWKTKGTGTTYTFEDPEYGIFKLGFITSGNGGRVGHITLKDFEKSQKFYEDFAITSDVIAEYFDADFEKYYPPSNMTDLTYDELVSVLGNPGCVMQMQKEYPSSNTKFYLLIRWYVEDIDKVLQICFARDGHINPDFGIKLR